MRCIVKSYYIFLSIIASDDARGGPHAQQRHRHRAGRGRAPPGPAKGDVMRCDVMGWDGMMCPTLDVDERRLARLKVTL